MPQWTRSEVRRLKKLYQEDTINRSKLLDTLSILSKDSGDGVNIRRAEAGSGQIEPFNQVDTRAEITLIHSIYFILEKKPNIQFFSNLNIYMLRF